MVYAIFFIVFKPDCHNMGIGIPIRYISVDTFAANETQMMGLDMAAWQESGNNVLGIA